MAACSAFLLSSAAAQSPQAADYVIGPQDVLTITVFDSPDMNGKYTVELDGTLSFPLIGRVKAGGFTIRQFEEELKKQLADGFFRDPHISVGIELYRSQRVFVVGEVRVPGAYPLTGDMTLIEALAQAGSTNATSANEAIIVRARDHTTDKPLLPGEDDSAEVIRVNIADLQSGKLSQNIQLRDGDTIFVPRAETVFVFGQVKNPGAYPVQKGTTVLQALSLAGGVTEYGAMNRIKVVRIVDGEKKEIKVKLTDIVLPGDTIIVPERYF